jgi:excisionase family DNA binding protein
MEATEPAKPRWYSIKEAAEYLDVGEPTLYRWMKDGKLTYRKVGDSTRFLREDLDAVVEVHPSAADVDKVTLICPLCHHDQLVEGRVRGAGLVYFMPKKTKFWTLRDSTIQTRCRMCTQCGGVFWYGDLSKLRKIQQKQKSAEQISESEAEG